MYGREYLDWRDRDRVARMIDRFLAELGPEDRVWALSVLRERHTVYKDPDPRSQLALLSQNTLSNQIAFQERARQQALGSSLGAIGGVLPWPFR